MMSIVEGLKFAVAYFVFLLVYFGAFKWMGINVSLIEGIVVFLGFTAAMLYLVVSNRQTDLSLPRFFGLLIAYAMYKMIMQNVVIPMLGNPTAELYNIPLIAIDLLMLISGVIWASRVLEEEQEIESEVVQIPY